MDSRSVFRQPGVILHRRRLPGRPAFHGYIFQAAMGCGSDRALAGRFNEGQRKLKLPNRPQLPPASRSAGVNGSWV